MRLHFRFRSLLIAAAFPLAVVPFAAFAQTPAERAARGDAVVRELNGGQPQRVLEQMRREFPFLAEATEAYALGDV